MATEDLDKIMAEHLKRTDELKVTLGRLNRCPQTPDVRGAIIEIEDHLAAAPVPPKEMMQELLEFKRDRRENVFQFFAENPAYKPWLLWLMHDNANYARALVSHGLTE